MRRGVPVAQVIPFPVMAPKPFVGGMLGSGKILGDIVSPFAEEWTVSDDVIDEDD